MSGHKMVYVGKDKKNDFGAMSFLPKLKSYGLPVLFIEYTTNGRKLQ